MCDPGGPVGDNLAVEFQHLRISLTAPGHFRVAQQTIVDATIRYLPGFAPKASITFLRCSATSSVRGSSREWAVLNRVAQQVEPVPRRWSETALVVRMPCRSLQYAYVFGRGTFGSNAIRVGRVTFSHA